MANNIQVLLCFVIIRSTLFGGHVDLITHGPDHKISRPCRGQLKKDEPLTLREPLVTLLG